MTPAKRKVSDQNTADLETSNLHNVPIWTVVSTEQTITQTTKAEKQAQAQRTIQEKNKTAMVNQDPEVSKDNEIQATQQDEYTQTALEIKALMREKANFIA